MKHIKLAKHHFSIAPLALGIAMTMACSFSQAQTTSASPSFRSNDLATYAYALQLFDQKRYAEAYGRFAHMADSGHAPSALMALAMLLNSSAVFHGQWSATPYQQNQWGELAQSATQGSAIAPRESKE